MIEPGNKERDRSLMDLSPAANPEALDSSNQRGIRAGHPASVLAPGSALGSLPSVALSSAQVGPIIVEQEGLHRKIAHAIRRADFRSWPITDPGESFLSADRRIANYTTKKVLASSAGKGVKISRLGHRSLMAGFGVATYGRF
jgi:hypothetical protein